MVAGAAVEVEVGVTEEDAEAAVGVEEGEEEAVEGTGEEDIDKTHAQMFHLNLQSQILKTSNRAMIFKGIYIQSCTLRDHEC